jgi:O-antigen ligase
MPPQIATALCGFFIVSLFVLERRKKYGVSKALCLPFAWMFFAGSRYPSEWLNLGVPILHTEEALIEGSPVDRAIFFSLIAAAVIVLLWRRPKWSQLLTSNSWIWLFFLFGAMSLFWSDYPFVSLKRLIKASGNVIMALVVLTDKRPNEAVGVLLRRLMFVVIPVSVVFVKYYPELGRAYHMGSPMYTGVATQKNGLGQLCLIGGLYFCWTLLRARFEHIGPRAKVDTLVVVVFMSMIAWLLHMSASATSFVCLLAVVALLLLTRVPFVARKPSRLLPFAAAMVVIGAVLEATLGVSDALILILGRDPTLTTRVPMWHGLLDTVRAPIFGVGFESFWLGDRLRAAWGEYGQLIQAHNGYLETYLNLGVVGVALIVGGILSGLVKVGRGLSEDYAMAVLKLCFVLAVTLYNWTEATFTGVNNMWLLFFLGTIDLRERQVPVKSSMPRKAVRIGLSRPPAAGTRDLAALVWTLPDRQASGR